jgi:hypothetical protein
MQFHQHRDMPGSTLTTTDRRLIDRSLAVRVFSFPMEIHAFTATYMREENLDVVSLDWIRYV